MVQSASLFSQLLQHFPRTKFSQLVRKHSAEKHTKGFTCWTQLVAMLFCHLAHADSLREICNGLACCLGKLQHLGIDLAPNKSTLSYANANRPAKLFEDLFFMLLKQFREDGMIGSGKHRFRFKNKLLSLDSTVIPLCLSMFTWAEFRRAKGGVKLHALLDHADFMPSFVWITPARKHDVNVAWMLEFKPGSIIAMDRAYNDYRLFAEWTRRGVFFVTRMKDNAQYKVVKRRMPPQNSNICADEIIKLTGFYSKTKCPYLLRRVVVWVSEDDGCIVLLTNHLDFGSTTISAIYKDRWQIEIFFKTLKQNLKIKSFVGTTENALLIQIWTALIALLLLKWLHHISKAGWSFTNLAAMLRMNLFTYRDLHDWLDDPFNTPPKLPLPQQLTLPLIRSGQLAKN
jgi:hypothetical protein